MKSIYKYPLKTEDVVRIKMPAGAEILTVQVQNGLPTLWALVNPDAPLYERIIEIFGTGNPVGIGDDSGSSRIYIGSYQLYNGSFVGHVFEYIEQNKPAV